MRFSVAPTLTRRSSSWLTLLTMLCVVFLGYPVNAAGDGLILVEDGEARASVVIADDAPDRVTEAASELVRHVAMAAGVELPVVSESQSTEVSSPRIYIGETNAAEAAGISAADLEEELAVIRAHEGDLLIAANDANDGALWGVYEVLDRDLGVRWLWPGELGTYAPATDQVILREWDTEIQPMMRRRNIRTGYRRGGQDLGLGFSDDDMLEQYLEEQRTFLRRHRMGGRGSFHTAGHQFGRWWERYGEDHPEWFHKLPIGAVDFPDRARQPIEHEVLGELTSMCVSNPEVADEVIRLFEEELDPDDPRPHLPLGEADLPALCHCRHCLAWDAHQPSHQELSQMPEDVLRMHRPFDAGRRYAKFWSNIHERALEIHPNTVATAFVYMNYFKAPTDIAFHENMKLSFVPWTGWWFPREPEAQEWIEEQWLKWRDTGGTLYYRPNYMLDGAYMPHVFSREFGENFQFNIRHGSVGTDFDTLTGQWAVQGPTLYLLMRIHSRWDEPVEDLLSEYYEAFGPAAGHIEDYFDFWEAHTTGNIDEFRGLFYKYQANRLHSYMKISHELYPEEAFEQAEVYLQRAEEAVQDVNGGNRYDERVQFVRDGFTQSRMGANIARMFAEEYPEDAIQDAFRELVEFRRSVEDTYVTNLLRSGFNDYETWAEEFDFGFLAEE